MKNRKPSLAICMRLADNLKALRKARGYTQAGLAQRTGFQETYIGNVEQATVNAPLASLEALAEELDCFEEDLLRRKLLNHFEAIDIERSRRSSPHRGDRWG